MRTPFCGKGDCQWPVAPDKSSEVIIFEQPTANPCVYVFINKTLGMSKGKMTAQGIHAAMMSAIKSSDSQRKFWLDSMHRTVLVMEARDNEHIKNIKAYLEERKFKTHLVIDEGVNEIDPHVPTALATSILNKDDTNVKSALSTFKLFREKIKVVTEIEI